MSKDEILAALAEAKPITPQYQPIELVDFLARDFPPREMLLSPILPTRGLAMLYAPRGIGKTYLALNIAYAVACGESWGNWTAGKPFRVIYVDGEMPATALQERLVKIGQNYKNPPAEGYFKLLAADLLENGLPDLSDPASWDALWPQIEDADLLVLDNLSTLCRYGRENESESWVPVQETLLRLRRAGIAVLLVHHAGKGGGQRGTSKREDILDTVIALRRPEGYLPQDGARFEVHIEKARGFYGDAAKPFEAKLVQNGDKLEWAFSEINNAKQLEASRMFAQGAKVREVAKELNIGTSTAGRYRQEWAGAQKND